MSDDDLSDREKAYLAAMELSMKDMDDLPGGLQALIYGESGVGKTVAAMKLAVYITPAEKTILYIDTAQGYKVRKNHPELMARKMMRIPYTGLGDLMGLAGLIEKNRGLFENIGAVIFDESTTMGEEDLLVVVASRAQYKKDGDPNAVATPDYGQAQNRFMKMLSRYAKLDGIHCIHIGHVRSDTMPNGLPQYSPSYTPKLGGKIRQPLDLVAYLTMNDQDERAFRNHPAKGIVAKCRVKDLSPTSDFKELAVKTKDWLANGKAEANEVEVIVPLDNENTNELEDAGMEI